MRLKGQDYRQQPVATSAEYYARNIYGGALWQSKDFILAQRKRVRRLAAWQRLTPALAMCRHRLKKRRG